MKQLITCILVVGCVASTFAQTWNWNVFNTGNSGVASDFVYSILQDTNNALWFGTKGGLSIYDGTTWTTYDTSNSPLPHNWVWSIESDSNNVQWLGLWEGQLVRFSDTSWIVYDTLNSPLPINNNGIYALKIGANNEKWIGTWGAGLFRLADTTWTKWNEANSPLTSDHIHALELDSAQNIWVGTLLGDGLNKFDGSTWTLFDTSNTCCIFNSTHDIFRDNNNDLWIGNNSVIHFDGSNWTSYNASNSGLPNNTVWSTTQDILGNYWFGTDEGLIKYDGTDWHAFNPNNSAIPDDRVLVVKAIGDDIWIGTFGGGIGHFVNGIFATAIPESKLDYVWSISPNPMTVSTILKFNNKNRNLHSFWLYDSRGRLVKKMDHIVTEEIEIRKDGLTKGVYLFRLTEGGIPVTSGKLLVE